MKFVAALAQGKVAVEFEAATLDDALAAVGLSPRHVDHGTVRLGVGIVVYEFGLYVPAARQQFFSIGRHLYAGTALLYGVGDAGETVDIAFDPAEVRWYASTDEIERAIAARSIDRPIFAAGGEVLWRWPEPRPDIDAAVERMAAAINDLRRLVIDGDTMISVKH